MTDSSREPAAATAPDDLGTKQLYCPRCHASVRDPLVCGDCLAVICRQCGSPLEDADELGMG